MTGGRKAYYRCCVPKCGQTSTTAPELSFHRIVREPSRREMWLLNMRCSESDLFCSSRICGDHFTFYDYEDFDANRLRKFAVPTLFAWEPLYTCQDVQEAPATLTASATAAHASSAAAAASASATIEIPDDDMDEEITEEPIAEDEQPPPYVGTGCLGSEQRSKAASAVAADLSDSERAEYDQLLLLVSVSERLAATQGTIADELARMRRAQLGQDRLLDALLAAVMRQDFPLPMTEADRAQLLAMRAAATVACASDSAAAAAPAAHPHLSSGTSSHQHQLRQHRQLLRGSQQSHHQLRHQAVEDEAAVDDGGDDDYDDDDDDDDDDANDADYNAEEDAMDDQDDEES